MNLQQAIEALNASEDEFGNALDTLQIELKDDYTQEEVDRIQAHLSNTQALPSSAPTASESAVDAEPSSRTFNPPSPQPGEQIAEGTETPIHIMTITPYGANQTEVNPVQLQQFIFDKEAYELVKATNEGEIERRGEAIGSMLLTYTQSRLARAAAEIDVLTLVLYSRERKIESILSLS